MPVKRECLATHYRRETNETFSVSDAQRPGLLSSLHKPSLCSGRGKELSCLCLQSGSGGSGRSAGCHSNKCTQVAAKHISFLQINKTSASLGYRVTQYSAISIKSPLPQPPTPLISSSSLYKRATVPVGPLKNLRLLIVSSLVVFTHRWGGCIYEVTAAPRWLQEKLDLNSHLSPPLRLACRYL